MDRRRSSGCGIRTMLMGIIALCILGLIVYAMIPSLSFGGGISNAILPQPTSTIKPGPTVIQAVRSQAKLETLEMVIAKDITIERVHGVLGACTEKITYLGYFKVSAGVDLRKIQEGDITVTNDGYPDQAQVQIKIPDAELLKAELDTANSKIVAQDTPKWLPGCSHEIADMTIEAQNKLREMAQQDAIQQGILSRAKEQAAQELESFLKNAGYQNLQIQDRNGQKMK